MPRVVIKDCLNCGVDHEWLFSSPTLKELRTIKKLTGWNGKQYAERSEESDPDALAALIYVLHGRDKINIKWDDVDLDFDNFEMIETPDEKEAREKAEAEAKAAESAIVKPETPKDGMS